MDIDIDIDIDIDMEYSKGCKGLPLRWGVRLWSVGSDRGSNYDVGNLA